MLIRCFLLLLSAFRLNILFIIAVVVGEFPGCPVFFVQLRPDLHGRPFRLHKFRNMTSATNAPGNLLPDTVRLARFGQFLQTSRLDEIPELINLVNEKMAIVGHRPLLMQYLPSYNPEQVRRHEVLPGITGWAQVTGRNAIS